MTQAVVAEAKELETDLILSYHPVIWDGLKKIRTDGPSKTVHEIIRSGISVFSIHTALDAVGGGVNDGLAEILGIQDPKPIGDYVQYAPQDYYKFVVFVPVEAMAQVANAVFEAGAGWIGNYRNCGFNTEGHRDLPAPGGSESGHRPTGQIREGPRGPLRDDCAGGQGRGGRGRDEKGPPLRGAGI